MVRSELQKRAGELQSLVGIAPFAGNDVLRIEVIGRETGRVDERHAVVESVVSQRPAILGTEHVAAEHKVVVAYAKLP